MTTTTGPGAADRHVPVMLEPVLDLLGPVLVPGAVHVDGTLGMIIVDPDPQALAEYRLRQNQWDLEKQKLKRLRDTRAATLDNVEEIGRAHV